VTPVAVRVCATLVAQARVDSVAPHVRSKNAFLAALQPISCAWYFRAVNARIPVFNVAAWAYDWLTAQPIWRAQIARVLDHVDCNRRPLRVLDLGCGPGVSSFVLAAQLGPASSVVGIDNAKLMIRRAERWHASDYGNLENVRFLAADATDLPFDDGAFDLAVGHSFLYLVPDRVAVLREVKRLLGADGTLVLMEPSRDGSLLEAGKVGWQNRHTADGTAMDSVRFGLSMFFWRIASGTAGRMHPEKVAHLFSEGGFTDAKCHSTLAGLGLHCVANGASGSNAAHAAGVAG
jgi:ubiquinone/menaquinone biosynthesis C-methylase UbiE